MRTVLVFVSTLDGKITKWGDPNVKSWSSKNDQDYFKKIWNESKLIVMGSTTYNADPVTPASGRLIIVMTTKPGEYIKKEVPGKVEFINMDPVELVNSFNKKGYELMTVVGGPHIATSFLKENLIDEIWLTIEPRVFGKGPNFVSEEELDIHLRLISCKKANPEGTMMTKYEVIKNRS